MADYIDGEVWRPVVGWESLYSVSNMGQVKRTARGRRTQIGRIKKASTHYTGYCYMNLCDANQKTKAFVHRLVMEAFAGPCPLGKEVNHKNGIKSDNRLENLEYVTRGQNIRHAIHKIRTMKFDHVSGQNGVMSKLTDIQADMIRDLYATGKYSQIALAAAFGVSQPAIWYVLNRRQETVGWTAEPAAPPASSEEK